MFKNQELLKLMIISYILITLRFDSGVKVDAITLSSERVHVVRGGICYFINFKSLSDSSDGDNDFTLTNHLSCREHSFWNTPT